MIANDEADANAFEERDGTPLLEREIHGIDGGGRRQKKWDAFMEYPSAGDDETGDSKMFEFFARLFKVVVYLIVFVVILVSAVVCKSTILLMTSAIKKKRSFQICRKGIGLGMDKTYSVLLSEDERKGWIICIIFCLVFPEILTFFKSLRICLFKAYKKPKLKTFITVVFAEAIQTFGLVLLVFSVLPNWDVAKSTAWSSAVCFIPAFLSMMSLVSRKSLRYDLHASTCLSLVMSVMVVVFQVAGQVLWDHEGSDDQISTVWPSLACILVSIRWWENYTDQRSKLLTILSSTKRDLLKSRYFIYASLSVIKIVFIVLFSCIYLYFNGEDVRAIFTDFHGSFKSHKITVYWLPTEQKDIPGRVQPQLREITLDISSDSRLPLVVFAVHAAASVVCYNFAKFACKIGIQTFSFSLPLCLSVPATFCVMTVLCGTKASDDCAFKNFSPYIFWVCPEGDFLSDFFFKQKGWLWLLFFISQTWLTLHIWNPKNERLASTQKLFVNPMYCSVLMDQSLLLNRRKNDEELKPEHFYEEDGPVEPNDFEDSGYLETESPSIPKTVPRIYACATMWHETMDEMEQLLKSIIRMDEDQSARKNAQLYLKAPDPDYYLLEVHVLFDDAFTPSEAVDDGVTVNRFVKDLVSAVDSAVSKVHGVPMVLKPPIKIPTPYGGRLVWTLPGGNHLYVHLKNKDLIRHKKRWSQVMYMYYLLGHRLMELDIPVEDKSIMAENTYILALDGDIDFRPKAVRLLVDLMNRNKSLGAACGRIHPVGTGAMAMYQKFEYAIGHWLQKATEHMIGCVLCSPGCFSLFRAKALMDDNVMRTYTTKAKEAKDFVQYDQGEDRWLCTLLLQRGYRVEYSAASDAYTHCPETFAEFYSQRRRWAPSTMANIMDLLVRYKTTVSCNDSISMLYIAYQSLLMVGTILGPGTIFLMLVGAMVSALGISNWQSFIANFVPIGLFIVICFFAKNDTQIFVAQVLSAGYALLMMAVLVGISLQLVEDGISSPSAIFLLSLAASFLISAILHPQEFWCVAHGLLYFLSVPSMYLLLTLYSMINLYVVSWGTREVVTKAPAKEAKEVKNPVKVKKQSNMMNWINGLNKRQADEQSDDGGVTFGLGNVFRCICCAYPKVDDKEDQKVVAIDQKLDALSDQVTGLQKQLERFANRALGVRRKSSLRIPTAHELESVAEQSENEYDEVEEVPGDDQNHRAENVYEEDEQNHIYNQPDCLPSWITDKELKDGDIHHLPDPETEFWKDLIKRYLHPLDEDPQEKALVSKQLKELRNKVVFGMLMLNSLFILIVFLLQMQKDTLHIEWPLNMKANITYIPSINEVFIETDPMKLEPVNLVLAFFFTLILVIQFVGMLFHRLETISHILASTDLGVCCSCCRRRSSRHAEDQSGDEELDKNAVNIAHFLQKLSVDEYEAKIKNEIKRKVERRPTVHLLETRLQSRTNFESLDDAFRERYESLGVSPDSPVAKKLNRASKSPKAMEALKRRASVHVCSRPNTPLLTRQQRIDLMRLNRAFGGTPNGSICSGFTNCGYDIESVADSDGRRSCHSTPNSKKKSSSPATVSVASSSLRVRFQGDEAIVPRAGSPKIATAPPAIAEEQL